MTRVEFPLFFHAYQFAEEKGIADSNCKVYGKMATAAQISSSLCCYTSFRDVTALSTARTAFAARLPRKFETVFATGSPLLIQKPLYHRKTACNAKSVSIRCEQSTKESNSLDIWVGRLAMVGFAAAITVEIVTGKGLLENFGLTAPLPTVALAVTSLIGVLAAIFIFQSASKN